jgi:hypothetical protein
MPARLTSSVLWLMLACALAGTGCRQTVVLDRGSDAGGSENNDGGNPFGDHGFGGCDQIYPTLMSAGVILAVDRSSAMLKTFDTTSRQNAALMGLRTVVTNYQNVVRFGYVEFPAIPSACGTSGGPGGGDCCAGDVTPPRPMNYYPAFDQALDQCGDQASGSCLNAERPIADTLARCRQKFMDIGGFGEEGRNHWVLLITGGEPTCSSGGGDPCVAASDEASRLVNDLGARTTVIALGSELTSSSCLNMVASSGFSTLGGPSYYYSPATIGQLNDELTKIVDDIAGDACHLELRNPITDVNDVKLLSNGVLISRDPVNGWDYDSGSPIGTSITLHGMSCSNLRQSGQAMVQIFSGAGCGSFQQQSFPAR